MILNKFAALVKRGHFCQVVNVKDSGMWLATGCAIYRATTIPLLHGYEQVRVVLNINEKTMAKVNLVEKEAESLEAVMGLDLTDYHDGDKGTSRLKLATMYRDNLFTGLVCDDGELVFYDGTLMGPVSDAPASEYGEVIARTDKKGRRYIVVRDGFDVLAAIMPMQVISKDFLADLSDFQAACTAQHFRDQERQLQEEIDLSAEEEDAHAEDRAAGGEEGQA